MRNLVSELKKLLASAEEPARLNLAAGDPARVECARSGTFTDMNGQTVTFTPTQLALLAARFRTDREYRAKCGHKPVDTDTPRFGSVKALEYDKAADRLFATVTPTEALIRKHREEGFDRASMELVAHPDGFYELDALSFLAARDPGIPGLAPAAFAAAESTDTRKVFVFSAAAEAESETPPEFAVVAPEQAEKEKLDKAGTHTLTNESDEITKEKQMAEANEIQIAELKAKLELAEKATKESEARNLKFAEAMKSGAADRVKAFMAANSKKLPMLLRQAGLEGFLTVSLAAEAVKSEPETVCFAAQDKKEVTITPTEGFMLLLAALPDQTTAEEEGEVAKTGAEEHAPTNVVSIGRNPTIKFADSEVDKKVLVLLGQMREKDPKTTYTQALHALSEQEAAK